MRNPGGVSRNRPSSRGRAPTMDEVNAALEEIRQNPNSDINGPVHVSARELRRRQTVRAMRLSPTIYTYDVPQDSSTLCSLCQIEDEHGQQSLFAGHDDNQANHRHLLCGNHYVRNLGMGGTCPTCRQIINIWRRAKVVRIAADGTETVITPGQQGGKRNHTRAHKRRDKRRRATRRR